MTAEQLVRVRTKAVEPPTPQALQRFFTDLDRDIRRLNHWGRVADYIPELAKTDPAQFGVAAALSDGRIVCSGQARQAFSIQSISKVFALANVLAVDRERVWCRVGREPSGDRYDSMLLLEREQGRPRNPFINAGALVVTDELLTIHGEELLLPRLLGFLRQVAEDADINVDLKVARSEANTNYRNAALAQFLFSFGNLGHPPDQVLRAYVQQCAITMNCLQLAQAGRFLAGFSAPPASLGRDDIRGINALMLTCGLYDGSGEFAYRVGLPSKSGVGGGLLLIVPGRASVAIWSPGLDERGNPVAAAVAAERIADFAGWSVL